MELGEDMFLMSQLLVNVHSKNIKGTLGLYKQCVIKMYITYFNFLV